MGSFYLGKYEVTQKEWRDMMRTNSSNFNGDNLPVERVSWFDAIEYCNKRSAKKGLTPAYAINSRGNSLTVTWNRVANGYRLPTEAEGKREARFGHKVQLSGWKNNLILTCEIVEGKAKDSELFEGTIDEVKQEYGKAPESNVTDERICKQCEHKIRVRKRDSKHSV